MLAYRRRSSMKGIMCKLKFEKAFNKINRDFLLSLKKTRGFPCMWVQWIRWITWIDKIKWDLLLLQSWLMIYMVDGLDASKGYSRVTHYRWLFFILVDDVPCKLLKKARFLEIIYALVILRLFKKLKVDMHFTDDTLLFCVGEKENLIAVKAVLLG